MSPRIGPLLGAILLGMLAAGLAVDARAVWSPERTQPGLAQAVRDAANASGPAAPGRLVVRFRGDAARAAPEALRRGFAARMGAARGAALDALLSRHHVLGLSRVFRSLERSDGTLRQTAGQRAAALRARFARRAARARTGAPVPPLENVFVLELAAGSDVEAAARDFAASPAVVYAEPERQVRILAEPLPPEPFLPDDPYVTRDGLTWSEGTWGQPYPDLYGVRNVRAIEGWNELDANHDGSFGAGETRPGEGVLVAVIDTGVDGTHPDLAANMWTNPAEVLNGVDDDGNGFVDDVAGWDFVANDPLPADENGHGTHVAGTIAAVGNNGQGIVGVAPWAQIVAVRGLDASGSGTSTNMASAVMYAVDAGADVLSNSWGSLVPSQVVEDAFAYAAAQGVLAVAAAGNSNANVAGEEPANIDSVIAVAAVDSGDVRASFSNTGLGVDVSAPGVDVLSLNANGGANPLASQYPDRVVDGLYLRLNGTSMACPHVSGVAAVLMSRFPGESIEEIRGRLRAGAHDISALNPGYEGGLGSGRVDLAGSLDAVPAPLVVLTGVTAPDLFPGQETAVQVELRNFWLAVAGVTATLSTSHPGVSVVVGSAAYGSLAEGQSVTAAFRVALADGVAFGERIPFDVEVLGNGYSTVLHFELEVTFFQSLAAQARLPVFDTLPVHTSVGDYDGDGRPDLHFMGFTSGDLYRNVGDGSFQRTTSNVHLRTPGGLGRATSLFLDYDGDGLLDLFVGGNSAVKPILYRNSGDGTFQNATSSADLPEALGMIAGVLLDWDRDDWPDVVAYDSAPAVALLRNDRDGTFSDATSAAGLAALNLANGQVNTFDYDGDGDEDIVAVSQFESLVLLRNDAGAFRDVTTQSRLRHPLGRGYTLTVGDYDGDLDLDVFVTGLGLPGDPERNALFRNNGNGTFTDVLSQAGDLAGSGASGLLWGTEFFDYDNDGDLDLYLTSEGVGEFPADVLFRNNGDGTFTKVNDLAFPGGLSSAAGTAVFFDYDGDGDLDLYTVASGFGPGAPGGLFRNMIGSRNHWLMLQLTTATGDREAIGTQVFATAGGVTRLREVHTSAVAQSPLHLGLGDASGPVSLVIHWSDGVEQVVSGILPDRYASLVEGLDPCRDGPDADGDGVGDACDTCPLVFNPGQAGGCAGAEVPALSRRGLAALALALAAGALALRRRGASSRRLGGR